MKQKAGGTGSEGEVRRPMRQEKRLGEIVLDEIVLDEVGAGQPPPSRQPRGAPAGRNLGGGLRRSGQRLNIPVNGSVMRSWRDPKSTSTAASPSTPMTRPRP